MAKIYSLRFKTLLMIFLVLILSVSTLSVLIIKTDFHYAEDHLIRRSIKMAENQAEGLSIAMWYYDLDMINKMISSWKNDIDIYKITVKDSQGTVIAKFDKTKNNIKQEKTLIDYLLTEDLFVIKKDIKYKTNHLGTLEFTVSKQRLYLDSADYIKRGSIFLLLLLSAIAILSYIGISLMVTGPLIELLHTMIKITDNDFSVDINHVKRKDEIGLMARSLMVFKESSRIRLELEREKEKQKQEQRIKEIEFLKSLQEAKDKAESANIAKTDFLANMSHELRTPLNGVLGMLSVLEEGKLTKQQHENINIAKSSGKSLLTLINDILDFSKIESGNFVLKQHNFRLKDVLNDIYNIVYFQVREKNINLNFYYDKSIPRILFGDSFRLKQILLNLVNNAVKFTDSGEVSIIARLDSQKIDCCQIKFFVVDTGLGIKREDVNRLFKKFSQLESSDTKSFGGTGLGLAIAQKLSRMMGGDVRVSSTYGKGSMFSVDINFSTEDAIDVRSNYSYFRPKLALVIIKDANRRIELIRTLDSMGFEVESIESLEASELKDLQEFTFSYVFLDDNSLISKNSQQIKEENKNFNNIVNIEDLNLSHDIFEKEDDIEKINPLNFIKSLFQFVDFESLQFTHEDTKIELENLNYKSKKGKKILVAEDNKINQIVLTKFLEKYNFEIDYALDGFQAIDNFKEKNYDLIFMDCQMPKCDGFQATKKIREIAEEEKRDKNSVIVALTAKAFSSVRQDCLDVGMDEYLLKPIDLEKLNKVLFKWGLLDIVN